MLGNFKPRFYLLSAIFITAVFIALIFNLESPKHEVFLASQQVLGAHTPRLHSDHSQPIKIIDGTKEWKGKSKKTELQDIISDLEVTLYPEDLVKCFPDPRLKIGSLIEIKRAPVVYLNDGGIKKELRSWAETVKELLIEKKIELGDLDKLSVRENEEIENGMKINITRIGEREEEEIIVIPYKVIEIADNGLLRGTTSLRQNGKAGKRVKKYHLIYENGILVSRKLISDEILEQPQNKIIAYGTKILVLSVQYGLCSWTPGATASRRYKRGTKLRVTNLANGWSVITTVGDYGPMPWTKRVIDLNASAFSQIADLGIGVINVKIEEIN